MKYPNYDNSMLSITASIEKHFKIATKYKSNPLLDAELAKNYKHVALFLIDGMGHSNISNTLKKTGFFRSHEVSTLSTVYPSTTVASTSVACSGKPPIATGWIGWSQYFKEYDDSYIMFLDFSMYKDDKCPRNIEFDLMNYERLWDRVSKTGANGGFIFPGFRTKGIETIHDQCVMLKTILDDSKPSYTYVYFDELDSSMHNNGISAKVTSDIMKNVESELEILASTLNEDTLLIVTADHGHIDIEFMDLEEHQDLLDLLKFAPTLEQRAMSFYIIDGKQEEFKTKFNEYYGDYYLLLSHQEAFDKQLFGIDDEHPRIHEFIGDFIACATTPKTLRYKNGGPKVGHHAGLTDEEMTTPLILINNRKNKLTGKEILANSQKAKNNGTEKNFNKIVGKQKDKSKFANVNFNG